MGGSAIGRKARSIGAEDTDYCHHIVVTRRANTHIMKGIDVVIEARGGWPLPGGVPVRYSLTMIDNKGLPGAPANGTTWDVSTITGGGGYVVPQLLPMLKLSAPTHAAMLSEAYRLEFRQEPIPEPSSLLALATGLAGLGGLALRRRRG